MNPMHWHLTVLLLILATLLWDAWIWHNHAHDANDPLDSED